MIEEPPLLKIRKPSRRPTEAQLGAFRDAPTGFVVDAMDGRGAIVGIGLPPGLETAPHMVGVALTCLNGPADILGTFAALEFLRPGDVVVAALDGHAGTAAVGDRLMGMIKNAGGAGFVTDAPARDAAGMAAVGLPVYCAGITPNSPVAKGPGEVGTRVVLNGVAIETGDILVGDADGVVVVPFARIDATIARLAEIRELEVRLDAEVAKGLARFPGIAELVASDRTRYLDD